MIGNINIDTLINNRQGFNLYIAEYALPELNPIFWQDKYKQVRFNHIVYWTLFKLVGVPNIESEAIAASLWIDYCNQSMLRK